MIRKHIFSDHFQQGSHILQVCRADGLPPEVPMFITEANISWQTGESFVDIFLGRSR